MTASRSHFTRTVAYASRHREIIAINVTDGEDVPRIRVLGLYVIE